MKFNKIEAGCYGAENGMLIKKGWAGLWRVFFNDNQLTVCETLKEAKGWIEEHERETHMLENMKAQELTEKPQESSEPVAQENIQPEHEDATESISEPHKASIPDSNKKYHVQLWKIGTAVDNLQDCGIWDGDGMSNFRAGFGGFIYQDGEWLYYASESLPDENNEIIKENTEKPTEEKSEGKEGITTSLIAVGEFLVIEERKDGESWAYYHGNDFLWSSAERFSQDDLLRMYGNGYFMEELKKQRIRKYDAIEKCKENDFPDDVLVRMRNELNAIDDEIARLFINGAKM